MAEVRIGIIGVSGRGKKLAGPWHRPGKESVVTAGADPNEEFLEEFSRTTGPGVFTTTDYRKLLARDDVDAVGISSPDFTHEEYAVEALKAGKHVFCEKPMAITTEGCDRIIAEWRKSGKKLMVGHNMRYMRLFRALKDMVDSGLIGEIKAAWVRHFVGSGGKWFYHDWHSRRDRTTGLLIHKAAHDIDMIHWIAGSYSRRVAAFGGLDFFGGGKPDKLACSECPDTATCPEAMPQSEPGKSRRLCAFREEVDVEDNSAVIMELENGVKASYLQCNFTPDTFRNYVFIGTEGRIENEDDYIKLTVRKRRGKPGNYASRIIHEIPPAEGSHYGADLLICRDFTDMILKGKEPAAPPEAARMSVAAGYSATLSLRNGGRVEEVPPMK